MHSPVLVVVVNCISGNRTELLAEAAEDLRRENVPSAAAVTQGLHGFVDLIVEYFCQLRFNEA